MQWNDYDTLRRRLLTGDAVLKNYKIDMYIFTSGWLAVNLKHGISLIQPLAISLVREARFE